MGNEAALKSMGALIQTMLPYNYGYEPVSNSGKTIKEIFTLLRESNSKLDEFEGFLGFILQKIDTGAEQEKVDILLMSIWKIINNHYPANE